MRSNLPVKPELTIENATAENASVENATAPEVSIYRLQNGEPKPPLFCIYGTLLYQEMAAHLNFDRPVYGIYVQEDMQLLKQSNIASEDNVFSSIPSIAACYLQLIRSLQSHGPYHLLGYSFGGVVAFEIAHQLQTLGETVGIVAMIDAFAPYHYSRMSCQQRLKLHVKLLRERGPSHLYQRIQENLKTIRQKFSGAKEIERVFRDRIHTTYCPKPYSGQLVLFRAAERNPFLETTFEASTHDMGWAALSTGSLEIFEVPGDHLETLKTPNVKVMAKLLQDCMDGAIADGSTINSR
jgi:thioesterase domain-containing protein